MDDNLDLSENKEAVLAQIDALHEKHRLQKLREIVDGYNSRAQNPIIYTEETPVHDLIIDLWDRNEEIPQELTFGDPYDSCFQHWEAFNHMSGRKRDIVQLKSLFQYVDSIPTWLVYSLMMEEFTDVHYIDRELWQRIPMLSQGEKLPSIRVFQQRLLRQKLPTLDLVFLAILLDNIGKSRHFSVENFINIATL